MSSKKLIAFVVVLVVTLSCLPAMATPYSKAVLADSPAMYWNFDTPGNPELVNGLAQDALLPTGTSSYFGHDPAYYGVYLGDYGVGSAGGAFVAADLSPTVPLSAAAGYTVEFWVRHEDRTGTQYIVRFGPDKTAFADGSGDSPNSEMVAITTDDPNPWFWGNEAIDLKWNHYTFVVDGGTMSLYYNGQYQSLVQNSTGGDWSYDLHWDGMLAVAGADWGAYTLNGGVDELAIYDRALTPAEIQSHYDVACTPQIAGDANSDDVVDATDAAVLAANWLTMNYSIWSMGDFNLDGAVDDTDATMMATNWGYGTASQAVPEPSMLAMLAGVLLSLVLCLRRKS